MSNQSDRQADLRGKTSAALAFDGDWHRYWDSLGVQAGTLNERMIAWINGVLSASYSSVPEAQHAYAASKGFDSWDAMTSLGLP